MLNISGKAGLTKTTSYKVVLPFYLYAAIAFLVSTILLIISTPDFPVHYFQPRTIAITHIMTLGWGTMIIFGASHQLVPVLIEGELYSEKLAFAAFFLAAAGIPLLAYGFYKFDMDWTAIYGGVLVILAIAAFLLNLVLSIAKSNHQNVHALFILTAVFWLLITASTGLMMVYNFTHHLLPKNSLTYLPLHAHIGIAGWFLLLVIGVSSRLIPLFLISKYSNIRQLWWIYALINTGLLSFIFITLFVRTTSLLFIPFTSVSAAIILFGNYCLRSFRQRIRRKVDVQMKISLLSSVLMMLLPGILLTIIISFLLIFSTGNIRLILAYGFIIFFGWLTAIILGMTFKTLPFIIWNKVYHKLAGAGKTPNPGDLFNNSIFKWMIAAYISGFVIFVLGILVNDVLILRIASGLLVVAAFLYNWNVIKLIVHKPDSI